MENNGGTLTNVQGSLHSGSDETRVYTLPGGSVTNFHAYLLEWTTNAINWFVDGLLYETQTNWSSSLGAYPAPFNQPFFILINLAVGGSYLGNPSPATIDSNSVFPGEFQVDYVRIYDQAGPFELSCSRADNRVRLWWPSNIVCTLQTQADALDAGLGGTWTDLPAATNPFVANPTNGCAFYRLVSP